MRRGSIREVHLVSDDYELGIVRSISGNSKFLEKKFFPLKFDIVDVF